MAVCMQTTSHRSRAAYGLGYIHTTLHSSPVLYNIYIYTLTIFHNTLSAVCAGMCSPIANMRITWCNDVSLGVR